MRRIVLFFIFAYSSLAATPKLTIAIVVDQLGWNYIQKLKPHFTSGLKRLLDKGVVYTEATYPLAVTATAAGHTTISTGALAKEHGIVSNTWFDESGKAPIRLDSSKQIFVDGLSDQVRLNGSNFGQVYALSIKKRATMALATSLGKAVWFDEQSGKLVADAMPPQWLSDFNTDNVLIRPSAMTWDLAHKAGSASYRFDNIMDDRFTDYTVSLENQTVTITPKKPQAKAPFEDFSNTPGAQDLVLDAGRACIDAHLEQYQEKDMLLWLSLSGIDKIGHILGPDSIATIDLMYHLDLQLERFMDDVQAKVGQGSALFMLTGDHGAMPIVEHLAEKGMNAKRIDAMALLRQMNSELGTKFGINGLIQNFDCEQYFFDRALWRTLNKKTRRSVIGILKNMLRAQDGIRDVWTPAQLRRLPAVPGSVEQQMCDQLYRGRSGDLMVLVHPYNYLTNYPTGTGHTMPYSYNQHVPLVFYQPGTFEKKRIEKPVSMLQVAPTLARILEVPRPSAARASLLPGLF